VTPSEVATRAGALLGAPATSAHATATVDVERGGWPAAVAAVRDDATNRRLRIAIRDDVDNASQELAVLDAQEPLPGPQRAMQYR